MARPGHVAAARSHEIQHLPCLLPDILRGAVDQDVLRIYRAVEKDPVAEVLFQGGRFHTRAEGLQGMHAVETSPDESGEEGTEAPAAVHHDLLVETMPQIDEPLQ